MNWIKCEKGHFFDVDTYAQCPQCGSAPASSFGRGGKDKSEHRGFSLFGQKNKQTVSRESISVAPEKATEFRVNEAQDIRAQDTRKKDVTEDFWQERTSQVSTVAGTAKKDVTMDFWQSSVTLTPQIPVEEKDEPISCAITETAAVTTTATVTQDPAEAQNATDALRNAVRAASASSEGKTMSYFSAVAEPASAAPESVSSAVTSVKQNTGDPVVGWLVCIQGPCLGWSFQIGAGNNSIGRKEENRIVIPGDMKISGIRHATITYEPKRRNFYLNPGEASGLTYLNDEYITAPQKLASRDVIELGDSKLLFVPLCGEDFSWENYLR